MRSNKKIHIISIGGSVMHDLAINLKKNGNYITGSDDKIYEPSKSNLLKNNLMYHKFKVTLPKLAWRVLSSRYIKNR